MAARVNHCADLVGAPGETKLGPNFLYILLRGLHPLANEVIVTLLNVGETLLKLLHIFIIIVLELLLYIPPITFHLIIYHPDIMSKLVDGLFLLGIRLVNSTFKLLILV